MITILSKIFLKDKNENEMRKSLGTLCSGWGIFLNVFLFVVKYIAGLMSHSVAICADAFNNLSDACSSFVTMIGFILSGKRPDREHPYGHGRTEYISGFIVALLILLMGFELLRDSVDKIVNPTEVDTGAVAIVVLVISILIKIYMTFYNHTIGKKIGSHAMRATALDSFSDSVVTTVLLVALLVMKFTGRNIDGFLGLFVAIIILYAGIQAAKETVNPLLGNAPDPEFTDKVKEIVTSHDLIEGMHDLMVHDYGPNKRMISLHVEVPGEKNIYDIHDMVDHIERELYDVLGCEAVIHMDPVDTNDEIRAEMKKKIESMISKMPYKGSDKITLHDFRLIYMDDGTRLSFDVVVPYDFKPGDDELKAAIEAEIEKLNGNYSAEIKIDGCSL